MRQSLFTSQAIETVTNLVHSKTCECGAFIWVKRANAEGIGLQHGDDRSTYRWFEWDALADARETIRSWAAAIHNEDDGPFTSA